MTSLLEKTISVIAPHNCIICSKENYILCDACSFDVFDEPYEACFLCDTPTKDSQVCTKCAPRSPVSHVWMAGTYDGLRRELIRSYKFERKQAAAQPLAAAMLRTLPYMRDIVVVPVPTAPARIRVRGYDQAQLLASAIAKDRGWALASPIQRLHNDRQVGASKTARLAQAQAAYTLVRGNIKGKHVLLVDDVTTSGATLQAVASLLTKAGAGMIDAVVVAKHTLK